MSARRMSRLDAIGALHAARHARDVVITTMMPARDWMTFPQQPLDLVFVPSAMGHATSLGLGIALAQPSRRVIICNGDGSMLMNLGSLVSIVASNVANVILIVFDNGVYEVTGSQPVPAQGVADLAALARGAGFRSVFEFDVLEDWCAAVSNVLNVAGPVFVRLKVDAVEGQRGPRSPGPARERARRFREALGA